MLASIFGLICLISSHGDTPHDGLLLSDSVKRPSKNKTQIDSTGKFVEINRIFVIGNRITRDKIILRELSLKSGDIVYTGDLSTIIDLDKKKLVNTRLFNTVEIRTLEVDPKKIDLLIDLNERWYTFPAPIFELADRNFNEWWQNYNHDFRRVNYGLKLYQFNMRGRNETLRLVAQFGYQRKFELSYRIPYIDEKQKQGLIFSVDYTGTKNLAYRTEDHKLVYLEDNKVLRVTKGASLTYTYRNSFYQTHALKMEYRSNEIGDTIKTLNPNYFNGESLIQQYGGISYSFTSDHRDYFAYPLKGHHFMFSILKYGITPVDDLNKFETSVSYTRYFTLKNKFFLSNNSVGAWSSPQDLDYANYTALGYRKQFVKGYEIYLIEGPYYLLNKTTFKKLLFSHTYHWGNMPIEQFRHVPIQVYLKTYADLGYVRNYPNYTYNGEPVNYQLTDKLLTGVGGGLDIVGAYDLVLRFEYTLNAEGDHGFFFHIKKEF
ncbi:MAG: hypothetical protein JNM57_04560 [Cyclobacteriaceae bacterium]|nr:hypothetical protein [Cyclobacteriaceae bacterium]